MRKILAVAAIAAFSSLGATAASAATCPSPADVLADDTLTRSFELTGNDGQTVSCYAYGTGNPTGVGDDPILSGVDGGPPAVTIEFSDGVVPITDLVLLDKSDADGSTDTNGLFDGIISGVTDTSDGTMTIADVTGITDYIVLIKSGNNLNPTWASWLVSDLGSFDWDIDPRGGNSHSIVYGVVVPVPAAGWLLLGGLGGLVAMKRRKRAA